MKLVPIVALLSALGLPAAGQNQLQQLTATGGVVCEQFGHGLAMSGTRIVAGAAAATTDPPFPCATGPGAAYVFDLEGYQWAQTQRLVSSDGGPGDEFGNNVSVSGNRIVVGAEKHDGAAGADSGAAYVFERQGTTWVEVAKLEPSDSAAGQEFARSVSISGDWIVCGTRLDSTLSLHAGAAYTFRRNPSGTWFETQKVYASDGANSALFGNSCSIDGNRFVVGAYYATGVAGKREGAAYVFELQGLSWVETKRLGPSPPSSPAEFGRSVSLDGDQIFIGARADSGTGAAYVFNRMGENWAQTARLAPSIGQSGDQFGESVSIRGNSAIVGARLAAAVEGRAFFYEKQGTSWVETAVLDPHNPGTQGWYGYNVAISTGGAAAGAPFDQDGLGSVCVYSVPGGIGSSTVNYCTAGTSASGCQATVFSEGLASATFISGFNLRATLVEGAKDGLFFFGTNGRQANPWGSSTSYQCVIPPVIRGGLLSALGTAGLCDGSFKQDLNALWCASCPKPLKNPGAGATVQAQLWYRDPQNTSNQTTSLSDAIEFLVGP